MRSAFSLVASTQLDAAIFTAPDLAKHAGPVEFTYLLMLRFEPGHDNVGGRSRIQAGQNEILHRRSFSRCKNQRLVAETRVKIVMPAPAMNAAVIASRRTSKDVWPNCPTNWLPTLPPRNMKKP